MLRDWYSRINVISTAAKQSINKPSLDSYKDLSGGKGHMSILMLIKVHHT